MTHPLYTTEHEGVSEAQNIILALIAQGRHRSTIQVVQYFAYAHLPDRLQAVSAPFARLVADLLDLVDDSPELTVALRKLLEGKDAAVRAAFDSLDSFPDP